MAMVILEVAGLVLGAFSASVGFSLKMYLLLNIRLLRGDLAYQKLLANKTLNDRGEVQDLLRVVRGYLATFDSPEFSQYEMLR
jgi:hypothetical protein